MGKTEFNLFIITANLLLVIFIAGILVFIFRYRKRKLIHEKEKEVLQEIHHKEILTAQLESQQQAMQYIGRDIHDNVGQKLTLAALYVQNLSYVGKYPEIDNELQSIGSVINESLIDLRQLSRSLVESGTTGTSLVKLLRNECERITASGICRVVLSAENEPAITSANKNVLYRIVQEFIQNSLKHSACKNITISLHSHDGLFMVLKDDGSGFLPEQQTAGIGLQNMYQRAALIGADLDLVSTPGGGTRLNLFIPAGKI